MSLNWGTKRHVCVIDKFNFGLEGLSGRREIQLQIIRRLADARQAAAAAAALRMRGRLRGEATQSAGPALT
jgi:hypothetical protein